MNVKTIGLTVIAFVTALSGLRAAAAPTAGLATAYAANGNAVIAGRIWFDRCHAGAAHCVPLRNGHGHGDGITQDDETGVGAVALTLTARCDGEPIARTTTDADGRFTFTGLPAGTYCVTVDPRDPTNAALAAGRWTAPLSERPDAPASRLVPLSADGVVNDVDFGRDITWSWPSR